MSSGWTKTETVLLSADWEVKLATYELTRTDREDAEWINLSSGERIALVQNGGWRQAEGRAPGPKEYRLFRMDSMGVVTDFSNVIPASTRAFRTSPATGVDTYSHTREECITLVNEMLSIKNQL